MSVRTVDAFEPRVIAEFDGAAGWSMIAGMTPRGGRYRAVLMPVMPSAYAETPVCLVVERQSFDAMGAPAWTSVPHEDEAYSRGVDAAVTALLVELTTLHREKAAAATAPASAATLHPPDLTMTDDVQTVVLAAMVLIGADDPLNPEWRVVEAGILICPTAWDSDRIRAEVAIRGWTRSTTVGESGAIYAPRPAEWEHEVTAGLPVTFFYAIDATPAAMVQALAAARAELGDRFQIEELPAEEPCASSP